MLPTAFLLLTLGASAEPPVARVGEPPVAWVTVSPTTHTYVYPTAVARRGVGASWAEQGGVFTTYGSSCAGGSCSAPGGAILGIGAARGFAGTTRPLLPRAGIFRRR